MATATIQLYSLTMYMHSPTLLRDRLEWQSCRGAAKVTV